MRPLLRSLLEQFKQVLVRFSVLDKEELIRKFYMEKIAQGVLSSWSAKKSKEGLTNMYSSIYTVMIYQVNHGSRV